jgi:hypothetical protein
MCARPASASAVTLGTVLQLNRQSLADFAVKEEDGWRQVPFCLPLRTGITLMEGVAEASGTAEIFTVMNHAEVILRIKLPAGHYFRLNWYQGVEGFTGWHACALAQLVWTIVLRQACAAIAAKPDPGSGLLHHVHKDVHTLCAVHV